MKYLKLTTLNLLFALFLFGCESDELNKNTEPNIYQKYIGGAFEEEFVDVKPSESDGHYILATKKINPETESHYLITKIDEFGNTEWSREFGFGTIAVASDMIVEENRILALGHMILEDLSTEMILWILDFNGNTMDSLSIGTLEESERNGHFVKMTDNSSYIVAAETTSDDNLWDNIIMKLEPNTFDIKWSKNYTTHSAKNVVDIIEVDKNKIVWIGSNNEPTSGSSSISINLADTTGIKIESVELGQFNGASNLAFGLYPYQSRFIIAGGNNESGSFQGMMILFDINENILVQETITQTRDKEFLLYGFQQASNGNLLVSGYQITAVDNQDQMIAEWDSQGNLIWEKVYENSYGNDISHRISESADGLHVFGTSYAFTNQSVILMKTNPEGELY
ncbi:hypothetical protein [Reichenbachiella versicolor]|uniref:hypothetical protein n=1 Tax=Reichenbachiella versicolor TaxID=1821036 RepID=UPI0013A5636F|nr:hypothetical protein [Reichenbachiella versicolor]